MTKTSNRNHTIDLLRFLAAAAVALFHFNEGIPYFNNFYRNLVKFGWLGVPVFFVISGYCILLTAINSNSPLKFMIRRLFRIFPPFWVSMCIVIAVAVIQKLIIGFNSVSVLPKTLGDILASILLYTDPISKVHTINWVYWSLSCELCFYCIVFAGLYFNKNVWPWYFLLITSISILIPMPAKGVIWYFLKDWPSFSLGICIFYLHNIKQTKNHFLIFLLLLFSVVALAERIFFSIEPQKEYYYFTFAILSGLLIWCSNQNFLKLKENFFSKLGDYSYSVYLIHVPLGVYLMGMLKKEFIVKTWYLNFGFDLLTYFAVAIISYTMFKYIELPAIKLGKSLTADKKSALGISKIT